MPLFLALLLPNTLFPIPCLFLSTHLPNVAHCLQAAARLGWGGYLFHHKQWFTQALCSQKGLLASPCSVFSASRRQRNHPPETGPHPQCSFFDISPCSSVQNTETVPSQCQALSLQVNYGFWGQAGKWRTFHAFKIQPWVEKGVLPKNARRR